MNVFFAKLLAGGPVVTDGAWGTELQARGLASGEIPDALNVTRPDLVVEVASAYAEAGSSVILTNTFGANRPRLAGHGFETQVETINRRGVELSRQGAAGRAFVFASIGPTGRLLIEGNTTAAELREAYTQQANALAAAGPDALVIETMSDLDEAKIALEAAKTTGLPVVACMVFDSGAQKDRTMMGATPEEVAEQLRTVGADAVGANCGVGIEAYVPVCRRLRAASDLPVWIKPNAGLPKLEGGRLVYRTTPEQFAEHAKALVAAGASFVGGCCGTTPDFIRALRTAVSPRS